MAFYALLLYKPYSFPIGVEAENCDIYASKTDFYYECVVCAGRAMGGHDVGKSTNRIIGVVRAGKFVPIRGDG